MATESLQDTDRFQHNLVAFLRIETDRGVAFCHSTKAELYAGRNRQARAALEAARNTLHTVRNLEARVNDKFLRRVIRKGANDLDARVANLDSALLETLFITVAA